MVSSRVESARRQVARMSNRRGLARGGRLSIGPGFRDAAWVWTPPDAPAPATEPDALGIPPFGRGLNLLTSAIASTEWFAARWDPNLGVDVRLADQPAVLTDPDPSVTPWHYKWAAAEDLILYGNHVALFGDPDFRTLRPGWLAPIPADQVWILEDPTTGAWSFTVNGVELSPDEVLHVSGGNRSGFPMGRGVLAQYGEWMGGAVAAETHAGAYFAGGALPPAVLQSPQVLTDDQAGELKLKWRAMTSTREPVVLPVGYVLTPLVSNAEQAQLVQSRQWNAAEAAMLLGIPAWKLSLAGPSMTYQNVETADIDFIRDSVDRWALPLSSAFTKWLMPRSTSVRWNYAGRQRADQTTTANVLTAYVSAGILTQDEARAWMGRPPMATVGTITETPAGVPELTPQGSV